MKKQHDKRKEKYKCSFFEMKFSNTKTKVKMVLTQED